jgi:hypothetical protein
MLGLNTVSVGVSAFGKHPAYADHLPDLGDATPLTARLRQTFYTGGIVSRVGDWDAMQKAGKAIPFGHHVLYREIDGAGVGGAALLRLWPSSDSVNRTDIPMILAAVSAGVGPDWLLASAPAVLSSAERNCKSARTLENLSAAVQAAGAALRALDPAAGQPAAERLAQFLSDPSVAARLTAIVAALRPIAEFLPLDGDAKAPLPDRPAASRVAIGTLAPLEALARWSALLDTALGARRSRYLLIAPDGGEWIDLIVGEPSRRQFGCIRAGREAMAPAAPQSNELTDDFGSRAVAWLRELSGGKLTLPQT